MVNPQLKKSTILTILCILATLFTSLFKENPIVNYLYFSVENLTKGYFWTLITALFIHANPFRFPAHLIGNIIFLYVFGGTLEKEVGSARMMLAFLLGGAISFILSLHFYGFNTRMIGASAAIFTLASIIMLVKPLKFSWLFFMPLGLVAILYFIYNVLAVYYFSVSGFSIGYWGHIIGFLIGIPLGVAWSRGRWKKNLLIAIILLILYLTVTSLIQIWLS